jgi:hypothetical protein
VIRPDEHLPGRRSALTTLAVGILAAVVGAVSVFEGVFGSLGRCAVPGAPCPSPSPNEIFAYGGLVLLVIGVALLVRAGWRGSVAGSTFAAVAAIPGSGSSTKSCDRRAARTSLIGMPRTLASPPSGR